MALAQLVDLLGPLGKLAPCLKVSQLFCDNLLQDMPIQTEVRDQTLQLAVFIAKLPQLPQLAKTKARIRPLPQVKALLAIDPARKYC